MLSPLHCLLIALPMVAGAVSAEEMQPIPAVKPVPHVKPIPHVKPNPLRQESQGERPGLDIVDRSRLGSSEEQDSQATE